MHPSSVGALEVKLFGRLGTSFPVVFPHFHDIQEKSGQPVFIRHWLCKCASEGGTVRRRWEGCPCEPLAWVCLSLCHSAWCLGLALPLRLSLKSVSNSELIISWMFYPDPELLITFSYVGCSTDLWLLKWKEEGKGDRTQIFCLSFLVAMIVLRADADFFFFLKWGFPLFVDSDIFLSVCLCVW